MKPAPPRVLVVEDQPAVRQWLADLVRQLFDAPEVVQAGTLAIAYTRLQADQPFSLALVDLGLPDGSGIALIRELQRTQPTARVVVTTVHDDDAHLFGAIAAGAGGYLLKEQPDAILLHQLRRLESGEPPLSPRMARRMLEYLRSTPAPSALPPDPDAVALTPRETEVLACIGRGLRVSETARTLGLTDSTVASYIKNLYGKLSIRSRAEAALEATRRGLA